MTQQNGTVGLGFKAFELFNLPLFARQAWGLLQQPESLSAWILRSIHYPNPFILHASLGNHPSKIWRSIIEGIDFLKQGLIKRIGNGSTTTNIWEENWLPRDEMLRTYGCLFQTRWFL